MSNDSEWFGTIYKLLSGLVGLIAFLGAWWYAVEQYGWFVGLGLCWLPALFIGIIAAVVWPLALITVALVAQKSRALGELETWAAPGVRLIGFCLIAVTIAVLAWRAAMAMRSCLQLARQDPAVMAYAARCFGGRLLDLVGLLVLALALLVGIVWMLPPDGNVTPVPAWARVLAVLLALSSLGAFIRILFGRRARGYAWYDAPR